MMPVKIFTFYSCKSELIDSYTLFKEEGFGFDTGTLNFHGATSSLL